MSNTQYLLAVQERYTAMIHTHVELDTAILCLTESVVMCAPSGKTGEDNFDFLASEILMSIRHCNVIGFLPPGRKGAWEGTLVQLYRDTTDTINIRIGDSQKIIFSGTVKDCYNQFKQTVKERNEESAKEYRAQMEKADALIDAYKKKRNVDEVNVILSLSKEETPKDINDLFAPGDPIRIMVTQPESWCGDGTTYIGPLRKNATWYDIIHDVDDSIKITQDFHHVFLEGFEREVVIHEDETVLQIRPNMGS